MISVEEAKSILLARSTVLPRERLPLLEASGRWAIAHQRAPYDHPLFDCSAVDGYALALDANTIGYEVIGKLPQDSFGGVLYLPDFCVRIFTGAMLPDGTDSVMMQERTVRDDDRMHITDAALRVGGNVRRKGEQLRNGDAVLHAGDRMDATMVGLLASVGVLEVEVARKPRVLVLITGNEFTTERPPAPGRIFGSNDVMLHAALREEGIDPVLRHIPDHRAALLSAWAEAPEYDVVITTGGVSVGDHDLVRPTLQEAGADILFHNVAQKPGKPMLFAALGNTCVLGLPGNPRAVVVLFHEYVVPYLRALQGASDPGPHSDRLPILHAVTVKGDRAEFRAALVSNGHVELLADEGSHMLHSLIGANALAYIPATLRKLETGDPIEVHYLPR